MAQRADQGLAFGHGRIAVALVKIARVDQKRTSRVGRAFLFDQRLDMGKTATLAEDDFAVFEKQILVGVHLSMQIGKLEDRNLHSIL